MRLLAIETTERTGSLAVLSGAELLAELPLPADQGAAQSLAPGLKAILDQVGWRPKDVEVVAVTVGPGSFTGLRVGVATAKTFAYSVKAGIVGVDTLEVIAAGVPARFPLVGTAIDAQRGDVVAESFVRGSDGWFVSTGPSRLVAIETWLGGLAPGTPIAGPVLRKIAARVPSHLVILEPRYWSPAAAGVGRLAARRWAAGHRDDLWTLAPRYFRRSAAEEKWDSKHGLQS